MEVIFSPVRPEVALKLTTVEVIGSNVAMSCVSCTNFYHGKHHHVRVRNMKSTKIDERRKGGVSPARDKTARCGPD